MLRGFNIFGAVRRKLDDVVRREKYFHNRRHHGLHGVAHVHRHRLRPAFLFVTEGFALIVLARSRTLRADYVVDIILRVVDLGDDYVLKFFFGYRVFYLLVFHLWFFNGNLCPIGKFNLGFIGHIFAVVVFRVGVRNPSILIHTVVLSHVGLTRLTVIAICHILALLLFRLARFR